MEITKFLIFKLDEETLTHYPDRMSDVPFVFDPSIPEDQMQEYSQIKLVGNAIDLHMLNQILFYKTYPQTDKLFDDENELINP